LTSCLFNINHLSFEDNFPAHACHDIYFSLFPYNYYFTIFLIYISGTNIYRLIQWVFPYWPGYHPETPIWVEDDNQANMEMPMY
jgi:hypothetical protein